MILTVARPEASRYPKMCNMRWSGSDFQHGKKHSSSTSNPACGSGFVDKIGILVTPGTTLNQLWYKLTEEKNIQNYIS